MNNENNSNLLYSRVKLKRRTAGNDNQKRRGNEKRIGENLGLQLWPLGVLLESLGDRFGHQERLVYR